MGQGEGHRDAPTIRGNSSTADFVVDGVRDDAQYYRDFYNLERVEALRGSNAMVFGRGGGGGVINRVTKMAVIGAPSVRTMSFAGGSFAHKRTSLDLAESGSRFAGRLNGVLESSDMFRDATTVERYGFNPTVAIRAGAATTIEAGFEHFTDTRTVNRGVPSDAGRPSTGPIETFFGDPEESPSYMYVNAFDATITHPWAGVWQVRNRTRLAGYDKYYQNVYPGGAVTPGDSVNLAGYNQKLDRSNFFNQTDLTLRAGSGTVSQTLLVGAEIGHQASETFRETGYFNDSLTAYRVPFNSPTVRAPVTFRQSLTDANSETTVNTAALYAQDEINFGQSVQAILGVRYDRFRVDFLNHRNGDEFIRVDSKVSPRAGLVFKPVEALSVYGSYSVSFLPSSGDQFGSLTVTTASLEPEQFTNYEAGVKWELRRSLQISAAVYRLDRTNTTAPHPDSAGVIVQTGSQRSKGIELGLTGAITDRWVVAGAFASPRAEITSRTTAALPGQKAALVPETTFSLWNRYNFTPWLGAGMGIIHQTDMFAAIDNQVTLPGFTRVDLAAFIAVTRRLDVQLNLENLFDVTYYSTSHGNNNIMPGAPRSVRVALTADL
jgi:catecholate siderophore receptor